MSNPDARFSEKPFSDRPDPRFVYWSRSHVMAVGALHEAVEEVGGLTVLHGVRGTGKSMLLCHFVADAVADRPIKYHRYPVRDDLQRVIDRAANPPATRGPKTLLTLRKTEKAESSPVHVIDHADRASEGEIARLLEFAAKGRISLILAGETGFLPNDDLLPASLACRRFELKPLDPVETAEYIRHRLSVAEGNDDIFSPGAVKRVHALSHGIPRNINTLCSLCLFSFPDADRVSDDLVDSVVSKARERGTLPKFVRETILGTEGSAKQRSAARNVPPSRSGPGTLTIPDVPRPSDENVGGAVPAVIDRGKKVLLDRSAEVAAKNQKAARSVKRPKRVFPVFFSRGPAKFPTGSVEGSPLGIVPGVAALVLLCAVAVASPHMGGIFGTESALAAALRTSPAISHTMVGAADARLAIYALARDPGPASPEPDSAMAPAPAGEPAEPQVALAADRFAPQPPAEVEPSHRAPGAEVEPRDPAGLESAQPETPRPRAPETAVPQNDLATRQAIAESFGASPPEVPEVPKVDPGIAAQTEAISLIARTLRDFTGWEDEVSPAPPLGEIEADDKAVRKSGTVDPGLRPFAPERTARAPSGQNIRLVIHHSAADRRRAGALVPPLRDRGFRPELRAVTQSIGRDHVRYFHREDLARARQVVGVLAGYDTPADLRDFSNRETDLEYGLLEVWLSD